MSSPTVPLSQETLAQFNHDKLVDGSQRLRRASVSTRRSSRDHSRDPLFPSRPQPPLLRRFSEASHLSPAVSYPTSPFHRRDSVFFSKRLSVGTLAAPHSGRVSFSGLLLPQPMQEVCMENTYRIGPEPGNAFSSRQTQQILQATLDRYLDGVRYSPNSCGQLCQILADLVRSKIKDTCPPRYKLVCQVIIGQTGDQSLTIASRGLLDTVRDDFASATFQNGSLFTMAIVYGIYYE